MVQNTLLESRCCGSILSLAQIFFSFVSNSLSCYYHTLPKQKQKQKQKERKFEPRIKLNHNIDNALAPWKKKSFKLCYKSPCVLALLRLMLSINVFLSHCLFSCNEPIRLEPPMPFPPCYFKHEP